MENTIVEIQKADGSIENVTLITYLISEDNLRQYIVYSKNEVQGTANDHVIYISKIVNEDGTLKLEEIKEDSEWVDVQHLLKKIANAEQNGGELSE